MSTNAWAVIPARGGSKVIPDKNICPVAGRPLLSYTIAAAQSAGRLDRFIVSTDSTDIAAIAKEMGALVPFIRPADLATDTAASLPVIQHAIRHLEQNSRTRCEAIVMLQPTCPLRTGDDIDAAVDLLFTSGADSVISVVNVGAHHPLRMKRIVAGRLVNYVDQGSEDMRPRQVLPAVYIRNGAIYCARRDIIMERNSFVGEDCRPYVMPAERSVNIDSVEDLLLAEHYLQFAMPIAN